MTIAGLPKDQLQQHIFGGSAGPSSAQGVFFTNLQRLRAYDTALVTRMATAPARQGLFRYVVGRHPRQALQQQQDGLGNPLLPVCLDTADKLTVHIVVQHCHQPNRLGLIRHSVASSTACPRRTILRPVTV